MVQIHNLLCIINTVLFTSYIIRNPIPPSFNEIASYFVISLSHAQIAINIKHYLIFRIIDSFELEKILKIAESNCQPNTANPPLNHVSHVKVS